MAAAKKRGFLFSVWALAASGACDPYQHFGKGDDSYGPVNPVNFPAANLGVRGDRLRPGTGTFTAVRAFAAGADIGYFAYPLPPPARATSDPLRLLEEGKPYPDVPAPPTYAFDPTDADPAPDQGTCVAPAGYSYDKKRDEVRFDRQGNIFTTLPEASYAMGTASASSYVPVVTLLRAAAGGRACQHLKSEDMVKAEGLQATRDGRYGAWLIIDPAAAVYPVTGRGMAGPMENPGVGLQSWGWYKRFLLAYLDGGYIPTEETMVTEAMVMKKVVRMKPQKLYIPRRIAGPPTMPGGMPTSRAGAMGAGYDVLQARRGEPGYSPLCEVWTYETGAAPLPPDTIPGPPAPVADLPKDAAVIEMMYPAPNLQINPAASRYVYCLQVKGKVTP